MTSAHLQQDIVSTNAPSELTLFLGSGLTEMAGPEKYEKNKTYDPQNPRVLHFGQLFCFLLGIFRGSSKSSHLGSL